MNAFHLLQMLLPDLTPKNSKLHFAITNGKENPLDVYYQEDFQEWQRQQLKRNFDRKYVVSFIAMPTPNLWLFAGVHLSDIPTQREDCIYYPLVEIQETKELDGRLIISFDKKNVDNKFVRQSYLLTENWVEKLNVAEVLAQALDFAKFPSFKSVHISFSQLKTIVKKSLSDWQSALSSVAGVYLIADKSSGKLYVGSATGEGGIWQRWAEYATNLHGNNRQLIELKKQFGDVHFENFYFSILEIADTHSSENEILVRESHWKNVLLTRQFGYNDN
ncbi:GIY-YIG nuclease family protein [Moraxella osloensis]|uniref:GIY-YIG nuclease family protein n=1 Tax=Faucicola osloensis TaxID=34062 RepID=UPI002003B967|nr:GIY-YIG nuclease family protein [Moraxella osloensis]MCK6157443.1 GIY-YIG nuclease family protein [Moraxella osloensis]